MENFQNETNLILDNETYQETIIQENITYSEQLNLIHEDLGFICCFIIFFVLVILLSYAYKFFDMCFKF